MLFNGIFFGDNFLYKWPGEYKFIFLIPEIFFPTLYIMYWLFHPNNTPKHSIIAFPISSTFRFRCVHHDVETSPSSNEEAQSDRPDKPSEEPEDPGSRWRGWWWWSAPLKGQIILHFSVIVFDGNKSILYVHECNKQRSTCVSQMDKTATLSTTDAAINPERSYRLLLKATMGL